MAIIFVRTLIIYLSLLFLMRLLGKRQLGQLELSELVVSVLVADLAAMPLQDIGIPLLNGLIPVFTLFAAELLLSGLLLRKVRLRALLCGKPCILIRDGVIQQSEMRRCRYTLDELTAELRSHGILDPAAVKFAVLETGGSLSTVLTAAESPVTPRQLDLIAEDPGYPYIVVEEGRILADNLRKSGHDAHWLDQLLRKYGMTSPQQAYIIIAYSSGKVYCARKEPPT